MSKIFEWDAQDGSFIARTGQIGTAIGTPKFNRTDKGYGLNTNLNSYLRYSNISQVNIAKLYYSIFCYVPVPSKTSTIDIFGGSTSGNLEFSVISNTGQLLLLRFNQTTNYGSVQLPKTGSYFIEVFYDGSQSTDALKLVCYINRVKQTLSFTGTIPSTLPINTSNFGFSFESTSTAINQSYLFNFTLSNIFPASKESDELYIKNINRKPLNPPTVFQPNLSVLKPSEIRENGLIAAYNFNPNGTKLTNVAWDNPANKYNARQYDIILNKYQLLKDGLKGNKTYGSLIGGTLNIGKVHTLCIRTKLTDVFEDWIYSSSTTYTFRFINSMSTLRYSLNSINYDFSLPAINILTSNLYIITRDNSILKFYTNGVFISSATISNNVDYLISGMGRGANTNEDMTCIYEDSKMYNRVLSDQEIKNYYNLFASKVVLQEDFKKYAVGNTRIGNWQVKSGDFIISEDSQGKYLECTSNGVIQLSLVNSNKLNIKSYIGTMTLSKTSSLTKLTATTNQICRLIELTQLTEV
jgi:hypothetical protein